MKKLIFLTLILMLSQFGMGQRLSPSVITPGGGITPGDQITLEWTLGEVAVETILLPAGIVTEGFWQPHLWLYPVAEDDQQLLDRPQSHEIYQIAVYPNPVQTTLQISLESTLNQPLNLGLYDSFGRAVALYPAVAATGDFEIDLSGRPGGVYFLLFRAGDGRLIRQFRVVKIQ